MNIIRATYRFVGVGLTAFLFFLFFVITYTLLFPFRRFRKRWKVRLLQVWARVTSRLIGLRINVQGVPPQPPFLLVSNHLSYLDALPFLMAARTVFIVKGEVKSWPVIGFVLKKLGMLFINKDSYKEPLRMKRRMSDSITPEHGLTFFPEGTTTEGETVKPFHTSLLQYAVDEQLPVSYAALRYEVPVKNKSARQFLIWLNGTNLLRHFIQLLTVRRSLAQIQFGGKPVWNTDRKEMAEELHQKVLDFYVEG